jgi:glycosyltransferase involved in cell wall biosynthesis
MKIAIISCYDQIDYIRTRVLRTAFASVPEVETVIVKNVHKGLFRYIEVPFKILATRLTHRPDVYVVTFRGYEMLPFVLAVKGKKPLVFDEMINAAEYLREHGRTVEGSAADRLFRRIYGSLLRRCAVILADTDAHARYSAKICDVSPKKYVTIPISTDESVFYPRKNKSKSKEFNIFYYGVMRRLHGLEYVLEAAVLLRDKPDITFTIGGDKGESEAACQKAVAQGARITYIPWVPFDDIPKIAAAAGLNLGGPFGDTLQSQMVITGKTFQFLACKTPVLIGRSKVSQGFKDRQNCLMVPLENPRAIADAILWAHEHPKELVAVASAGRKLYEDNFSEQHVNQKIAKVVESL